jgi:hypothetical protein
MKILSRPTYFVYRSTYVKAVGLLLFLLGFALNWSILFNSRQSYIDRPHLLNLIYLEHYNLEIMSVYRLLYHKVMEKCQSTNSASTSMENCQGIPQYKFVIREPRDNSKIMTALVLLDLDKHNDILVVSNRSDIIMESLQAATQSRAADFFYLSDATSWIHFPNMIKFVASLPRNKTACFGCFQGSGEIDFDFYKNPGTHAALVLFVYPCIILVLLVLFVYPCIIFILISFRVFITRSFVIVRFSSQICQDYSKIPLFFKARSESIILFINTSLFILSFIG